MKAIKFPVYVVLLMLFGLVGVISCNDNDAVDNREQEYGYFTRRPLMGSRRSLREQSSRNSNTFQRRARLRLYSHSRVLHSRRLCP